MPYLALEDFKRGLDGTTSVVVNFSDPAQPVIDSRETTIVDSSSLTVAENVHITRGGELETRKRFVVDQVLPDSTFGLIALNDTLFVFGSNAAVTVPSGYQYQRLQHPSGVSMSEILSLDVNDGAIYAIAKYVNGDVFHFYDGEIVEDWVNGLAATGVFSLEGVAAEISSLIDANASYSASVSGAVITVTGETNVDYSISTLTTNGGSVNDQSIATNVTTAFVAETLPTGSFTVTGGTLSSGVNTISSILIDGIQLLDSPVDHTGNDTTTAAAIAAAITAGSSGYTATNSTATVTITARTDTGAADNGKSATIVVNGDFTVGSFTPFSGGVDFTPKVTTFTFSGTFEGEDVFTITLQGVTFSYGNATGTIPVFARTYDEKIYTLSDTLLVFSGVNEPTNFTTATGIGNINISNNDSGSQDLKGFSPYQNNLAIFSDNTIQIWSLNNDPANNVRLQTLRETGTFAPKSILQYGDIDVFYLSYTGIRSLNARDSSNAAFVNDVGVPVDSFVSVDISRISDAQAATCIAVSDIDDGRLWEAIPDGSGGSKFYVFSFFRGARVSGWSNYIVDFMPEFFTKNARSLYARAGNTVYLYGGATRNEYPTQALARIRTPFFAAGRPNVQKTLNGVEASIVGEWEIFVLIDPNDTTNKKSVGIFNETTFPKNFAPVSAKTTHFALEFVQKTPGYGKIAQAGIYFDYAEDY